MDSPKGYSLKNPFGWDRPPGLAALSSMMVYMFGTGEPYPLPRLVPKHMLSPKAHDFLVHVYLHRDFAYVHSYWRSMCLVNLPVEHKYP